MPFGARDWGLGTCKNSVPTTSVFRVDGNQYRDIRSFNDLVVWQKAIGLAELVYTSTRRLPTEETYGLKGQMRRAVVSVASNIAEGHARNTTGEYLQFVGHAMGSLAELETQVVLSKRLRFMDESTEQALIHALAEIGRMLSALRKSLRANP